MIDVIEWGLTGLRRRSELAVRMAPGLLWVALLAGALTTGAVPAAEPSTSQREVTRAFLTLIVGESRDVSAAFALIEARWDPSMAAMALDAFRLVRDPEVSLRLVDLLDRRSGESFGYEINAWLEWLWERPQNLHEEYSAFKAAAHSIVDPRFAAYFSDPESATVRLDEVVWGGVRQDGIPPLRAPQMIGVGEADYLGDEDVVFGVEIAGDARAYPQRILAWHEMFVDVVGGIPVAGVYCTLCGTVILYRTEHQGVAHQIGTSGFLYRSNKLMYDQATQSLWSTFRGTPVIGPLVGKGIELERLSVVTSTWGEWRRRHPNTTVLSLETGYQRDYAEGAAYRGYFATDELMFPVPAVDGRLNHKDEIFALLLARHPDQPVAISARYLQANPIHHERIGAVDLVVLTDPSGANRAYDSGAVRFVEWDGDRRLVDADGKHWTLSERALVDARGSALLRLPAHRAFWFGWYAAFPHTRLVD